MAVVSQDSEEMIRVAEDIRSLAENFLSEKNKFFDEVHSGIGEDETKVIWYGPNAGKFITEFDKTEEEFQKAYDNIISMASNLESQANSWNAFENGN